MPTITVLGGCGAVGSVAARTLAADATFDHVVVADLDTARAAALADGLPGATAARVDATDPDSLRTVLDGADVVLNCTGPFYAFGTTVLQTVIDAGIDYVDVCDDVDATYELLELDGAARAAGVRAVIGMGNSPGVTNLLARLAADVLLDSVEAVDIYHAHGGEPFEGEGVIAHRLHGMGLDIPMFLDGELTSVRFFEPSGLALRERVDLHLVGEDVPVYPYPHPEQVTLPRHVPLRRVTNRGTVLPDRYFELTTEVARLGLTSREELTVKGLRVAPHDVAVAWLQRERDRLLAETGFGTQRGCAKVVVEGTRHGAPRTYVFSMASQDQALGEGTGIPAAMGAMLLQRGKVTAEGVLPPEACVSPLDFLALVGPVLAQTQQGGSFDGILVQKIDAGGEVETVDLPF